MMVAPQWTFNESLIVLLGTSVISKGTLAAVSWLTDRGSSLYCCELIGGWYSGSSSSLDNGGELEELQPELVPAEPAELPDLHLFLGFGLIPKSFLNAPVLSTKWGPINIKQNIITMQKESHCRPQRLASKFSRVGSIDVAKKLQKVFLDLLLMILMMYYLFYIILSHLKLIVGHSNNTYL